MKNRPTSILFSSHFILIVIAVLSIQSECPRAPVAKLTDDDFRKQRLATYSGLYLLLDSWASFASPPTGELQNFLH